MNKKRIVILVIILIAFIPLLLKVYDTYKKYTLPEEKWFGIGEGFEYAGLEYKLKNVEEYSIEKFGEVFGLSADNFIETGDLKNETIKYFVMTLDLTAVDENYEYDYSQIGYVSKYTSSYSAEYDIMFKINPKNIEKDKLKVGETAENYLVFKFSTLYYDLDTLNELEAEDIAMGILDYKNGCANFLCKGEPIQTNGVRK